MANGKSREEAHRGFTRINTVQKGRRKGKKQTANRKKTQLLCRGFTRIKRIGKEEERGSVDLRSSAQIRG
jgi:hypothetical protein